MKKNERFFQLFSNCILVRGACRATVCDLQKGCYVFIPNNVADAIQKLENQALDDFLNLLDSDYYEFINTYIQNLISLDLAHICDNRYNFPKIKDSFQTPNIIEDSIIELSQINYENIAYIMDSLTELGCKTLELRAYEHFSLKKIRRILNQLPTTRIRSVELYLKYNPKIDDSLYFQIIWDYKIIDKLVLHSFVGIPNNQSNSRIYFTNQNLSSADCCGNILPEYFTINLPFYLEGLKKNTCLNRKLSISQEGLIKNCPALSKSFGKITNSSIKELVTTDNFQKLWHINKSKIKICKDCEFRAICSDCRAFINTPFDKPLKCNYDPYTMSYT